MRKWYVGIILLLSFSANAQVNQVVFGKNRVQHNKLNWKFFESKNFNVFFTQNGLELAKFVLQDAEKELRSVESFVEYSLQKKANIIVYNNYDDYQQSNIGLGIDWQSTGGVTKLVNNKIILYFDGNHAHLHRDIRIGIARSLVDIILFGEDIGEIASNQALLDLPKWLTDGYVEYAGEPWSTEKDDQLKSAILGGTYKTFYAFAFKQPTLAGNAFWNYIATRYGKENVSYFFYLTRIYKSLNKASLRICKMKFKEVLKEFMEKEGERFDNDITRRKLWPKGFLIESLAVNERLDYFHFAPNPAPKSRAYAVCELNKGRYRVVLSDNDGDMHVLLKQGVLEYQNNKHPHYPLVSWDPKGTRLAIVYWKDGKNRLMVYDFAFNKVEERLELSEIEQVQNVQYMLDANTLLISGVRNGHSDIFIYKIKEQTWKQVTNDIYDDLDASFVAFPNKSGIIFSSNRPSPDAPVGDTILPHKNNFNIFLADVVNDVEFKQITQLSKMKYGNARYPTQYNVNHFTFVSDENGIGNRYAGFFTTQKEGLDTLYFVGEEVLRNPENEELDSTLQAWNKPEPDSIGYISISKDSAYTFPISNYESSLRETRIAGDKGLMSEVTQQGNELNLYKLKIDTAQLRKRSINPAVTAYMKRYIQEVKTLNGDATYYKKNPADTAQKQTDFFQNEFSNEQKDSNVNTIELLNGPKEVEENYLNSAKLFKYRFNFSTDYFVTGLNNTVLFTRYQQYFPGITRFPIKPANGNNLNLALRMGVSDMMEDWKIYGGWSPGLNFENNEWMFGTEYLKYRFDFGADYYRKSNEIFFQSNIGPLAAQSLTQIFQGKIAYPFDKVRSLRMTLGYRTETVTLKASQIDPRVLSIPDSTTQYLLGHIEYVHDNTLNPTQNIWEGLRYKVYADYNVQLGSYSGGSRNTINLGFDARYYYPIYRNLTWAVRAAADFSWGNRKFLYVLGGTDGWYDPSIYGGNDPAPDEQYSYLALGVNLRGFKQNIANGNNVFLINSEVRLPIWTTIFNQPINNAFLRNLQLVQFLDLGTAWNGQYNSLARPTFTYTDNSSPVLVTRKAGGIGPFAGGYGFGLRSTLLGYFMKVDAAWEMNGFFRGKPLWYFSIGLDF